MRGSEGWQGLGLPLPIWEDNSQRCSLNLTIFLVSKKFQGGSTEDGDEQERARGEKKTSQLNCSNLNHGLLPIIFEKGWLVKRACRLRKYMTRSPTR